ncbi:GGDEF domain-containing protein [Pseudoduganella namucuonensis]|uniref:diguanylate cyclase n=1 Tax=Pseudoduganella namucuonensis TaxID=1035707 RepID=A0A1I7KRV1_9BURK|nr:GGDEF domain-containing protein [Pseudoduganella namucuonensis]SFV00145.1 diguanylate cyclase (GGDEF) domain-containing protein [Pseudoduganella namucuonensis]
MNRAADPGELDADTLLDCCRYLSAVVVAVVREDGRLLDCNTGFRRLLRARIDAESEMVASFFFRPAFGTLAAEPPLGEQPIYRGMLIVGDNQVVCHSLLGVVHRLGDKLVLFAEFDIAELENLNQQVLQFNEQLIEMQRQLARRERRLRASEERLRQLSNTDPLTGLANRRHLEQFMRMAAGRTDRLGETFSIIMLDIDHFKRINDVHGHDAGDVVLCHLAGLLGATIRGIDLAARVGGEEFVLVLPATGLKVALECAERLREAVARNRPPGLDGDISASFGVVQHRPGDGAADLLKHADEAMYIAKNSGRNRVVAYAGPSLDLAPPDEFR